jgi:hypothetical protein
MPWDQSEPNQLALLKQGSDVSVEPGAAPAHVQIHARR